MASRATALKIYYNNIVDSARHTATVSGNVVRVGRRPDNDIVLDSPYVPEEAFVLRRRSDGWEITVSGLDALEVAGQRLAHGSRFVFSEDQELTIFPFVLSLDLPDVVGGDRRERLQKLDEELAKWIDSIHGQLLQRMDLLKESRNSDGRGPEEETVRRVEYHIEELANVHRLPERSRDRLIRYVAGVCVRTELLSDWLRPIESEISTPLNRRHNWSRMVTAVPNLEQELAALVVMIADRLCPAGTSSEDVESKFNRIEEGFWGVWEQIAEELHAPFCEYLTYRVLKKQLKDTLYGYGPLEDLLRMPMISEIMVVNKDQIYVEKGGLVQQSGRRFLNDEITVTIIERIVAQVNRRIDRSSPLVDARLSDGSRVNAIIPPLAVSGPCLTVRKFPLQRLRVDDLIRFGAISAEVARFLHASVLERCNMIVSGGTGTGKTTLLNCLSDFIPDRERIVTVEDTAELQLHKQHVVRLEARSANVEGAGKYTIGDLVRNALRMRPDRIVVGECRGGEALDMLQAMNTGHDGSLTTLHANSARDAILRLEVLVQMAANLPLDSIHRQIASAVHLIVQLERYRDGSRCVTQISEVTGIDPHLGSVQLRDLFVRKSPERPLLPTGHLPTFLSELVEAGRVQLKDFFLDPSSNGPT